MSRQSDRARRDAYAVEDAERKRQASMTIDDERGALAPAGYLAAQIAEVDRIARAVDGGKDWVIPEGGDMATLARVRACALSALWRLPVTRAEHDAYPAYAREPATAGERLLSHAARFASAVVWRGGFPAFGWASDYDRAHERERRRAVFTATTRVPYSKQAANGGERDRYTYTVEELGRRAETAARIARKWGLVEC